MHTIVSTTLLMLACGLAPLSALRADTVTGKVVDSGAKTVAGAKVVFIGVTPTFATSSNGFFSASVPAGTYTVRIIPGTSLAPVELRGVVVSGTTNLGTITLKPGFMLSGTVLDTLNRPIAGVKIDVVDSATKANVYLRNDVTGSFGTFQTVVPAGTFDVLLKSPTTASFAPHRKPNVKVTAATTIGIVALKPGFVLSGTVLDTLNRPIAGVDIDVFDALSNTPVFLLHDGTAAFGNFQVVVPAGIFHVVLVPPAAASLAPGQVRNVKVTAATTIGTVALKPGFALSGTVVDPTMKAVAQADINVLDATTGRPVFLVDDNANALGKFSVVVPAGVYNVRIRPPANIVLVAKEIPNVKVTTATSLGTVTLTVGVLLVGRVVDASNSAALAKVDVDIEDARTGERIATSNDETDLRGIFRVIAPPGLLHVSFSPPKGSTYIGQEVFNVRVNGNTNMGTVALTKGLVLSGTVLGPSSTAVVNADIDVRTSPGRVSVFIPHDNTDSSGNFSVIVPAGTYELTVEPRPGSNLVGARRKSVAVAANTKLTTITLAAGVTLSGTIANAQFRPEFDADIDVVNPTTGEELVTANDNTNINGKYFVTVPNGTWNVRIQTAKLSPSRVETLNGVVVNGATVRNHKLSNVPIAAYLEGGIPTVANGGSVLAILLFGNINSVPYSTKATLVLIDPNRKETVILGPLFAQVANQQLFLAIAPIGLPPVNTALLGQQFRLQLRFDDPKTGAEQDHSGFKFFIK